LATVLLPLLFLEIKMPEEPKKSEEEKKKEEKPTPVDNLVESKHTLTIDGPGCLK